MEMQTKRGRLAPKFLLGGGIEILKKGRKRHSSENLQPDFGLAKGWVLVGKPSIFASIRPFSFLSRCGHRCIP